MDGIQRPVGDLPTEVYWRRRVVAVGLLILAALVLYYLIKPLFGSPEATPTPVPTPTPTPSASAAVDLTTARECGLADLTILVAPSPRDFPAGSIPLFNVTITHTGFTDCVLDTAAEDAQLLVTSGSDRIWSNLDCPGGDLFAPNLELLSPDDTRSLTATWPRIRSDEQCSTTLPAPGAPGTYRAVLTLQGVEAEVAVFTLSN